MVRRRRNRADVVAEAAAVAAMLIKKPSTHKELVERMGLSDRLHVVDQIEAFRREGLVYVQRWEGGRNGNDFPVFAWQPSVCFFPDAPRPVPLKAVA